MSLPHVVVFGSINMDLVAKTPRLPRPGETLTGHSFSTVPGGKGANQAVAIARLDIPTVMIGRVGNDRFGQELLQSLQSAKIQIEDILVDDSVSSGVALIAVDDEGENTIVVIPSANGRVNESDVERLSSHLTGADSLLLQLEIPIAAVKAAAQAAKKSGVRVILDPAPARSDLPIELYPLIDILTPNEGEAEQLVGFPIESPALVAEAATILQQRGVKTVVIKLGAKGGFCATPDEAFFFPAFQVAAIDTVAAGDAFNGGLAAALAAGKPLREAMTWGAAAGALATTKPGAQSSLPDRATLITFLEQQTNR
ncbi:ribokinase [Phormidesmis priestleyi ULC007]|uniref:Ribokinase n=1 Tax=Phormidesmis priestleyi ULC007 TaxID=1920490 RepID=A0A2T1DNH1_9CYAN|nr:ribokinase [Phormidesmis priestleyi]PSB22047.1 ribokinase [Phormidesmis priestleyi ULC007]PZO54985.1 MAG: ribokinase [Phormidesmis priestleyi]